MKIAVAGTRGFPGVQGGVETHCMELYPRVAALGADVTVFCRRPYTGADAPASYRGVTLRHLPSPTGKHTEAFLHTLSAIIHARRSKADIIHIHACGPALLIPLARLLGMKTVVTLHGQDYRRAKWGLLARTMLRIGEWCAGRMSHAVILLSEHERTRFAARFPGARTFVIPNGIPLSPSPSPPAEREKIILAVGRLTPEKGFHHLVEAWQRSPIPGYRLIIAGGADRTDPYATQLTERATRAGITMTGTIGHDRLAGLYSRAALFILPSLLEGLPIALLEAMSYHADVAVSSIPSCRLPQLEPDDFFTPGSPEAIEAIMRRKLASPPASRSYDLTPYDWDKIATLTLGVYDFLIKNP